MIEVRVAVQQHPMHKELTPQEPVAFKHITSVENFLNGVYAEWRDTAGEVTIRWPVEEERPNL